MTSASGAINDLGLASYDVRPLVPTDARAVFELMAAVEREALGEVMIEEADIVGDWQRPSFDIATQSIGVFDGPSEPDRSSLVGYAEVYLGRRCDAAVHPSHRGHGIEHALLLWTQRISRRDGSGLVGMPVPVGAPLEKALQDLGYHVLWTSWSLELPADSAIAEHQLPDGYRIAVADSDALRHAAHSVKEDAFLEWADRQRETYADFAAGSIHRPGFEDWQLRVMLDAADSVVGVAHLVATTDGAAYVEQLAVRRDQRGLGLARALLADAFAVARTHGCDRGQLSTDSRTGALGLYLKIGMQVSETWQHWAIQT